MKWVATLNDGTKRIVNLERGVTNSDGRFICLSKMRHKQSEQCPKCIAGIKEIEPIINNFPIN